MDKFHRILQGLALVLMLGLPWAAQAQVTRDWINITPNAYGDMVAMDQANNVYVAGSVPWSTMLITKYSPTGVQLWQRSFDNPGTREQSSWITIDPLGNAIVTGYLVAGASNDPAGLVVLKYDPAGNLLWQDITPSAFAYAWRARTDGQGNVYVLGSDWVANSSGNTTQDMVTLKYSPAGVRQWQRYHGFSNLSADAPAAMAVTPAGNVIVVGGALGQMLMAAYDPAGNRIWSRALASSTGATDVAVGAGGEFFVVGGSYNRTVGNMFMVVKHDAAFNALWNKTYNVGHYALRAAVDSQGNAVVTGVTGSYFDWMTLKLDPNGSLLWSRRYDQHLFNDEIPLAMVMGPDNAAYITGQGGPGPSAGELSYLRTVTLKYAADGTQLWAATSFDSVRGLGVALGSDNSVAVLGESPLAVMHYTQGGVNPPPGPLPTPTALTVGRAAVVGGRDAKAVVTVSGNAGVLVSLSSSNPAVAAVPASVQIPAGATSAVFVVRTARVRGSTAVTIGASANNATVSAVLTVVPR